MGHKQTRLGVDIGGTFTDIVMMDGDGTVYSKKLLSTPVDYSAAIEIGIAALCAELLAARWHGEPLPLPGKLAHALDTLRLV